MFEVTYSDGTHTNRASSYVLARLEMEHPASEGPMHSSALPDNRRGGNARPGERWPTPTKPGTTTLTFGVRDGYDKNVTAMGMVRYEMATPKSVLVAEASESGFPTPET